MALVKCPECSSEVSEMSVTCPKCGYPIRKDVVSIEDSGSNFGFAVLGFFIPIVGLVLYLVWNKEKPGKAKSAGKGALVSVILWVLFYVLVGCMAML